MRVVQSRNINSTQIAKVVTLAIFAISLGIYSMKSTMEPSSGSDNRSSIGSGCNSKGIPPLKNRNAIGDLLEEHKFKTGLEIGIQQTGTNNGIFSSIILKEWKSCISYSLIDIFKDGNNTKHADYSHDKAEKRLKPFSEKVNFIRGMSSTLEAANNFENESLDFIYIDADSHDYCQMKEDLELYWPLIKPGGIISGHDYITKKNNKRKIDTSLTCKDGTSPADTYGGGVRGAVNDFFISKGLTISVTYLEYQFITWVVQKPSC